MHITLRINCLIQPRTQHCVKNSTKPPHSRIARIRRVRPSHIRAEAQAGQLTRRITRIRNAFVEAERSNGSLREGDIGDLGEVDGVGVDE